MLAPSYSAAVEARLDELCAQFPLGYRPTIEWKPYRVTAGMAYYRRGAIGLSTRVLRDEVSVIETLTHEYAHLLAIARSGHKAAGHGEPWRKAMADLGLEPRVRHAFEVERNSRRQRVIYVCLRCRQEIVRSRRLPRRKRYVHAHCGGDLRLSRVEPVIPEKVVA